MADHCRVLGSVEWGGEYELGRDEAKFRSQEEGLVSIFLFLYYEHVWLNLKKY